MNIIINYIYYYMPSNKKKNKKNKNKKNILPHVSICTPTLNRRPFFSGLIKCVESQDYPKDKIEWVIVDDGSDPIEDLIKDISYVNYVKLDKRIPLGKKRNFMHQQCKFKDDPNNIIVYMDDDDFYPPDRVSHAVSRLTNSNALCAGSSEIYIWFNTLDKMYKFGPYGKNHATAGTFAFKRSLLNSSHYQDDAVLAEEKHFLKNYTVPFVQLDPLKTILVFSHEQNTFDKRRLVSDNNPMCKESSLEVRHFIKDDTLISFYKNEIGILIKDYEPGDVKNKPEVLAEIERRDKERAEQIEQHKQKNLNVRVTSPDGNTRTLNNNEIIQLLQMKTKEVDELKKELNKTRLELLKYKNN